MYKINFNNPIAVHFIGIGGISMSGLAEILLSRKFTVSGSDRTASDLTDQLAAAGIRIFIGQRAENITDDIALVVYTSAVKESNPEMAEARRRGLPLLSRAELLGQLMENYNTSLAVSGTHGKTTTSSMLSDILLAENTDPTLSVGGIVKSINCNVRVGDTGYFLTEACEYTDSFLSLYPTLGIILNIEEDHLDYFRDLNHIRDSFHRFALQIRKEGALIINNEIENKEELISDLPCSVFTFGMDDSADYYASNLSVNDFGHASFTCYGPEGFALPVTLRVPGIHNVKNALAAIAAAHVLHISDYAIRQALEAFSGAGRRFDYKGTVGGVRIVDDYAHHPTEISATLTAAKQIKCNTLWCVFQPHTYSRTKSFLDEFATALAAADRVVLLSIYAARETDTLGVSSEILGEKIRALGTDCHCFKTFDEAEIFLLENCTEDDLLITMGAGDVYKIGDSLLGK